ncbi:MAG: hypothetical protein WBI45_00865 [Defluviitoga tunisiensis]|jgi:acyl carrier protein
MEIEDKLKDIINIILEKNEKERIEVLNDNLSLRNDLEMNSLDLAEFTVRKYSAYKFGVCPYWLQRIKYVRSN